MYGTFPGGTWPAHPQPSAQIVCMILTVSCTSCLSGRSSWCTHGDACARQSRSTLSCTGPYAPLTFDCHAPAKHCACSSEPTCIAVHCLSALANNSSTPDTIEHNPSTCITIKLLPAAKHCIILPPGANCMCRFVWDRMQGLVYNDRTS